MPLMACGSQLYVWMNMSGTTELDGCRFQSWRTLRSLSIEIEIPVIKQKADTMSAFLWIPAASRAVLMRSSTYPVSEAA